MLRIPSLSTTQSSSASKGRIALMRTQSFTKEKQDKETPLKRCISVPRTRAERDHCNILRKCYPQLPDDQFRSFQNLALTNLRKPLGMKVRDAFFSLEMLPAYPPTVSACRLEFKSIVNDWEVFRRSPIDWKNQSGASRSLANKVLVNEYYYKKTGKYKDRNTIFESFMELKKKCDIMLVASVGNSERSILLNQHIKRIDAFIKREKIVPNVASDSILWLYPGALIRV